MSRITVDVQVNDVALQRRLDALWTPDVALQCHNILAKMCDPYVPFLHGPLSQSGMANVTPEAVIYTTPYARYQYYGTEFNHTLDYHPLASALWDKRMLVDHGEEFNQQVTEVLKRKAQELG